MIINEEEKKNKEEYEKEIKILLEICKQKTEEILANSPQKEPGMLDGSLSYEMGKLNRWFIKEFKELKKKYNINEKSLK